MKKKKFAITSKKTDYDDGDDDEIMVESFKMMTVKELKYDEDFDQK